jgi:hypothetical protein
MRESNPVIIKLKRTVAFNFAKKSLILLCLLMCISLQITGCGARKPTEDIRAYAYQLLDENDKAVITDWKNAELEESKFTSDYSVYNISKGEFTDLKGKDVYIITFETRNPDNPITMYIDKESNTLLGFDLRM